MTNICLLDILYIVGVRKVFMKIEKIKKTGKKYKIVFDDDSNITTYDDVIINNGLLYNTNVDIDILNKINKDTSYYDAYYKCVNYITKKLRSEKEVNEYLDKIKVTSKEKNEVINKLKEIGLINDFVFAKAYISDSINLSSKGPIKIKKELQNHNIKEDVIEEEISKIDNNLIIEKITKLINKKTKNSKYTGFVLKQKVVNDLINLGYSKELIVEIYDSTNISNDNLLKKEYDKLYKKLSTKYTGYELGMKIKTKLYQKGFTNEEINSVIEID